VHRTSPSFVDKNRKEVAAVLHSNPQAKGQWQNTRNQVVFMRHFSLAPAPAKWRRSSRICLGSSSSNGDESQKSLAWQALSPLEEESASEALSPMEEVSASEEPPPAHERLAEELPHALERPAPAEEAPQRSRSLPAVLGAVSKAAPRIRARGSVLRVPLRVFSWQLPPPEAMAQVWLVVCLLVVCLLVVELLQFVFGGLLLLRRLSQNKRRVVAQKLVAQKLVAQKVVAQKLG
jgi:hypothetical protein